MITAQDMKQTRDIVLSEVKAGNKARIKERMDRAIQLRKDLKKEQAELKQREFKIEAVLREIRTNMTIFRTIIELKGEDA